MWKECLQDHAASHKLLLANDTDSVIVNLIPFMILLCGNQDFMKHFNLSRGEEIKSNDH